MVMQFVHRLGGKLMITPSDADGHAQETRAAVVAVAWTHTGHSSADTSHYASRAEPSSFNDDGLH